MVGLVAPAQAALRVGMAVVEITPAVGTPLGGYAARNGAASTGVHDPIMAKALVLDDGGGPVAIVTTDLIGTSPAIRRRVLEKTGLASERLLLCASHTHSGPGAFAEGAFAAVVLGKYDPTVFAGLADGIAAAIGKAREQMAPGRIGAARVELPGRTRNRRHAGDVTDPELIVLSVHAGKRRGVLVNLTAHGTVLDADNLLFSADWMGPLQADLERRLGSSAVVLYTNGAEGDQSPVAPETGTPFERADAYGRQIADAAWKLLRKARPSGQVKVSARTEQVALPRTPGAQLLNAGPTTLIQTVTIGDALLIAIPGEPIAELGLKLKTEARSLGWKHPIIVGLANDHLGYLLTEAEFRKGGYETGVSFFGPRFGEDLTEAAAGLIEIASGREASGRSRLAAVRSRQEVSTPAEAVSPPGAESGPANPEATATFLRDWFAGLPAKIGALPADVRTRIRVRLEGPGGGVWRLEARDGRVQVGSETADAGEAELTVTASADDWVRLLQNKLNLTAAFSGGRLRLTGDLSIAVRLAEWLGLRRGEGSAGRRTAGGTLERLSLARLERVRADVEALRAAVTGRAAAGAPPASSPGRPAALASPPGTNGRSDPNGSRSRFEDIRTVIHAHSHLSHDSRGTREEILAGAKAAGVRAILMTDHYTHDRRFLREALRGMHDGVLFIPGAELSCGLLCFGIDAIEWPEEASATEILQRVKAGGGMGFIAHPEQRSDWSLPSFVGMEIYNTHADAEDSNSSELRALRGEGAMSTWMSLLQAFRRYPREAFASIFDPPTANLARWDSLNRYRRVVGIAGNDSHNNVGAVVRGAEGGRLEVIDVLGKKIAELARGALPSFLLGGVDPSPGQAVLELRLDPYDVSYGYVSTHILAESLSERHLLKALARGRCYVAFDWIADPTGFLFEGRAGRRHASMGETLRHRDRPRLRVESPLGAEIRLLRDGQEVARTNGALLEHEVAAPGAYRAEVWVTIAGEPRPWIYANPIRVR
jgi:hypothetical protein